MSITVAGGRTQWAVGQGLFHSGSVELDGQAAHFVYDCGAQDSYRTELDREIDAYLNELPDDADVVVFISHLHHDHVSGLERLLRTGRVAHVVLPLLPLADRLFVLGQSLAGQARGTTVAGWYVNLVSNPVGWITERAEGVAVTQVIPDGEEGSVADVLERRQAPEGIGVRGPTPGVVGASDATVTVTAGSAGPFWALVPWVLSAARARQDDFLDELVAACAPRFADRADVVAQLSDPTTMVAFAATHSVELRAAYDVFRDLNTTSLHLYSGPSRSPRKAVRHTGRDAAGATAWSWSSRPVGWIGTGDSPLKAVRRAREFAGAFGVVGRRVGTMVLPHHGADSSFNPAILDVVPDGSVLVAPADAYSTWKHPGPQATRAASVKGELVVVTGDDRSRWRDDFTCTF